MLQGHPLKCIFAISAILSISCQKVSEDYIDHPIVFNNSIDYGSLVYGGSNKYKTVNIGTQVWMAENLKTIKFNDSTDIPLVTNSPEWFNLKTPGYCWYINLESNYRDSFGALYNWYTVNTGKLCPPGWHVPTKEDWEVLINYLGKDSAGIKIRETGNFHWASSGFSGTNESGFTAVSTGLRWFDGFRGPGFRASWWTSSEVDSSDQAYIYNLRYDFPFMGWSTFDKESGNSVRCIKN